VKHINSFLLHLAKIITGCTPTGNSASSGTIRVKKILRLSYFKKATFHPLRHLESRLNFSQSRWQPQATACFGKAMAAMALPKGAKTIF
jgi:hypothetical protein